MDQGELVDLLTLQLTNDRDVQEVINLTRESVGPSPLSYQPIIASTGYSPFFLDHLRECVLPMDCMTADKADDPPFLPEWVSKQLDSQRIAYDASTRCLRLHALNAQKRYDLKHDVSAVYRPGDRVLLIRGEILDKAPFPKAAIPTDGPFIVSRRLPRDRYVLTNLHTRRIHNVVHVSRLVHFPKPVSDKHPWMVNDPSGNGKWPVHSVIGRRHAKGSDRSCDTDVEYRVRWLGLPKHHSKWLHLRYLTPIMDLVNQYDDQHGHYRSPLPLADTPASAPVPPPSEVSLNRARFTRHPHDKDPSTVLPSTVPPHPSFDHLSEPLFVAPPSPSDPLSPDPPNVACPPSNQSSLPVYGPHLPDTSDRFPVGTRVDVLYEFPSHQWWTGTVVASRVYQPKTPGLVRERRITVKYDDPSYAGETFEHGLNGSTVRFHQPHSAESVNDRRTRRRLERLQRQLSRS